MQRKLVLLLSVAVISLGLLACGSQESDLSETMEAAAASTPEAATDESDKTTEVSEEAINESETEDTEAVGQEENLPTWYMDSEGLKNNELGIMVRKDGADWADFEYFGSLINHSCGYINFTCNSYEGDLESYISEHEGMEKETLEGVAYAVREPDDENSNREVAFVGNGIALSMNLWDYNIEDIEDIWENGLSVYEEDNADCLAYIRGETLYCPALGIKFSGDEDVLNVGIHCGKYDDSYGSFGRVWSLYIHNGTRSGSSEEELDDYVKQRVDYGDLAIDVTVEKEFGNFKFTGRGCSGSYGEERWLFLSDESACRISIYYTEGYELEEYISVIEEIKQ